VTSKRRGYAVPANQELFRLRAAKRHRDRLRRWLRFGLVRADLNMTTGVRFSREEIRDALRGKEPPKKGRK
jgi:hypothetical protein